MARRDRATRLQRKASLDYPCPTCDAQPGEPCRRPRGERSVTSPHVRRIPKQLPPTL